MPELYIFGLAAAAAAVTWLIFNVMDHPPAK